jgi:hypothetical protein
VLFIFPLPIITNRQMPVQNLSNREIAPYTKAPLLPYGPMKSAIYPIALLSYKLNPIPIRMAIGNIAYMASGVRKNIGILPAAMKTAPAKNCI